MNSFPTVQGVHLKVRAWTEVYSMCFLQARERARDTEREPKRTRESHREGQREPERVRESQRESQREPKRAIESQR